MEQQSWFVLVRYLFLIMPVKFEWDGNKNTLNQKDGSVSIEELKAVFYDDNTRLIADRDSFQ
jgi:uncharacterized DUF497 family protein